MNIKTLLFATALSLPIFAHAAAPEGVTGILAELRGGSIHVQWDAPQEGADVASYRVYWSTESILQNGGTFDDFEDTESSLTEFTLQDVPAFGKLFISVLAVNAAGEESPFFLEEAMVEAGGTMETQQPVEAEPVAPTPVESVTPEESPVTATVAPPPIATGGFDLLSIRAESATGVALEFSHPIALEPTDAARAFGIGDAEGKMLPLTRLVIDETRVTIHTLPQVKNKAYVLVVSPVVRGRDSGGALLSLEQAESKALFMGHETGIIEEQTPQMMPPEDVSGLKLRATAAGKKYTVLATWQPSASTDTEAYDVFQTRDRGATWSQAQRIPANALSVQLRNVEPGSFGLMVRAVAHGLTSRGVMDAIELPILQKPQSGLPQSGMGAVTALIMTGAVLGVKRLRKNH